MRYFIYQGNNNDCGFASLKMLLASTHKNKHYLNLKKPENKKGNFSIKDLIQIGKENGLILKAYQYEQKFELVEKDFSKFLAIINNENNNNHVVMIESFKDNKLTIYDPGVGIYKIEFNDFVSIWTGYTIEIEEVQKVKFSLPKVNITKNKLNIYEYIISILSLGCLLTGLYFIDDINKFYLPLILLSCFAILELIGKLLTVYKLKKVDTIYLENLSKISKDNFEEEYKNYNEFIKMHFTIKKSFITSLVVIGLISVLLILNSPFHAVILLLLLIIVIVDRFLIQRKNEQRKNELGNLEKQIFIEEDEHTKRYLLDTIHNSTYQYAFNEIARKCIYTFIVICCSLVMMLIQEVTSVNFVLFEIFILNYFVSHVDNSLKFASEKEQYDKLKAHFIDTFVN